MPSGGETGVHALVKGRVQGVGFRYSAVREARRLGLRGTVANTPDGDVAVAAEGATAKIEAFLAWLRRGPPGAWVSGVEVEKVPATGRFRTFDVTF